jgi:uncharacterized protein YcbK (DUF882 family)
MWNSKYFKRREFACACGCGMDTVDYELVVALDAIRDHFDRPVLVTPHGGCRCESFNRVVGGAAGSQHLRGRAADIIVMGTPPSIVADLAEQMLLGGVGRYDTFTHVDTRHGVVRWKG